MDAPAGSPARPLVEPGQRVWFAHAVRGPACLLVVFAHLLDVFPNTPAVAAPIGHFPPVTGLPAVPWAGAVRFVERHGISPGALGVLLFFLVSGFVIPFSLDHGDPRGFFVRRFFRLYPTLWTCLLVTVAALALQAHVLGTPLPYGKRVLGSDALLVAPYLRLPWAEPVLWSLAVEELFYLLAATAAWRVRLTSQAVVAAMAVGLAATCALTRGATPGSPLFWLGFNATYIVFILIGVVLHCLHRRLWTAGAAAWSVAGLFALYLVVLHNGPAAPVASVYVWSAALAVVVFCGLFLARRRLPYSVWVDRLSNISYPLYLLHGVNGYIVLRAIYLWTGSYYLAVAVTVPAALLAAAVVHRLVETPTNAFGRRLSRRVSRGRRTVSRPTATQGSTALAVSGRRSRLGHSPE